MTSRDFAYWLQGYLELTGDKARLTRKQMRTINEHLALVMRNESSTPMSSTTMTGDPIPFKAVTPTQRERDEAVRKVRGSAPGLIC